MANVKALQALLPLLDLKTDGRNPSELLDTYVPMLDVTPMFIQEQMTQESQTLATATAASVTYFTVPESEMWLVDSISCRQTTIGISAQNLTMFMRDFASFQMFLCSDHASSLLDASNIALAWASYREEPVLAQPGFTFGVQPSNASAGSNTAMHIRYKALQI